MANSSCEKSDVDFVICRRCFTNVPKRAARRSPFLVNNKIHHRWECSACCGDSKQPKSGNIKPVVKKERFVPNPEPRLEDFEEYDIG